MHDISATGFRLNLQASVTFPSGFDVTQFADDADPFDTPEIQIADKKMGLNGDLVVWGTAVPIEVMIAVVPGSDDDTNLAILLEANRIGANKTSAQDLITLTGVYSQGNTIQLVGGKITNGQPATSIAAVGRYKTKSYKFAFENRAGAPA